MKKLGLKNKLEKNSFLVSVATLGIAFCMWSCQTASVLPQGNFQKAQWDTKAQIQDLKKNKTHQLNIDIRAIKNEKMRIKTKPGQDRI